MAGIGGTLISRGNVLSRGIIAPSLTPVEVAASTAAEQAFTISGLAIGDFVEVNYFGTNDTTPAAQTAGLGIVNARVSAANTLRICFSNSTAGALTPAAGIYHMAVSRAEAPMSELTENCA